MAFRFLPVNHLPATCVFYHVTGYPCLTCGMTRATIALAHLDLRRAMEFHPLAVVFAAAFALWWVVGVYEALTGRRTAVLDWARRRVLALTLSAFGLLFVFGVLRIVM